MYTCVYIYIYIYIAEALEPTQSSGHIAGRKLLMRDIHVYVSTDQYLQCIIHHSYTYNSTQVYCIILCWCI